MGNIGNKRNGAFFIIIYEDQVFQTTSYVKNGLLNLRSALTTTEGWEVQKVSTNKRFVSFKFIEYLFFKLYFRCSSGSLLSSFIRISVLSVTPVVSIRIHKYQTGRFDTSHFETNSSSEEIAQKFLSLRIQYACGQEKHFG